jgi:hypothetical protein
VGKDEYITPMIAYHITLKIEKYYYNECVKGLPQRALPSTYLGSVSSFIGN